MWLTAVRGFIKHFFQCAECSQHFVAHASTEVAARVQTKRQAVLWAWEAHNKVRRRHLGAPAEGEGGVVSERVRVDTCVGFVPFLLSSAGCLWEAGQPG